MRVRSYVLIEAAMGKTRDVARALRQVEEVETVDVITGPYDVVAVIEAEDILAIGDIVTAKVHTISGVVSTVTSIAVGPN